MSIRSSHSSILALRGQLVKKVKEENRKAAARYLTPHEESRPAGYRSKRRYKDDFSSINLDYLTP